ncbi:MAG: hypothetical protein RL646_1648, partial [Verrucomicrobiota bacterium]
MDYLSRPFFRGNGDTVRSSHFGVLHIPSGSHARQNASTDKVYFSM